MRNNIVVPVVTEESPALIKAAQQGDLEVLLSPEVRTHILT
jgi:hypothetical protein